jgi:hypothetical protein
MDTPSLPIALRSTAAGVLLPVRAQPGARRSGIVGVHAGCLKVALTQPPEAGRANAQLLDVLADALGVRLRQLTLTAGAAGRRKTVLVAETPLPELAARIAELLGPCSDDEPPAS